MRVISVVGAVGLLCLAAAPCFGQQAGRIGADPFQRESDPAAQTDVDLLRQQVQALQEQLQRMEGGAKSDRVTQIGGTRPMGRQPQLVVRIYDLGDLFAMAPPYEAKFDSDLKQEDRAVFPRPSIERTGGPGAMGGFGGMGGMGGGMGGNFFNVKEKEGVKTLPDPARQVLFQNANVKLGAGRASIDDLIETITTTINPSVWDEVGGPASISSLGTSLIVSADEQTHEQIDALLNLFRKRWGTLRTVSVRAYWLWLTDEGLAALLPEGQAARAKTGETPAFGLVDPQAWQKCLQEAGKAEGKRAGYRAALTCYNGQTVYTISGGQSLAVTDVEPLVVKGDQKQPEDRVAYRPQISVIHDGAALQVTPIASNSGKFVVIDVHSRVVQVREPAAAPKELKPPKVAAGMGGMGMGGMGGVVSMPGTATPSPAEVVAVLDRPRLTVQRFSTTLRLPVEKPMLVGGMTFESAPVPGEPNLYLFLNVSVQELRDDVEASKPAVKPKGGPAVPREAKPDRKPKPKAEAKPAKKPQ